MLFEPQKHRITERIGLEWTLKPTEFQWAGNFGFALFPHKNWWVCRRSRSRLLLNSCSDLRKSRHISAWLERGWFQQHQLHRGHVGVSWTHPAGLTCAPWRGRAEGETAPEGQKEWAWIILGWELSRFLCACSAQKIKGTQPPSLSLCGTTKDCLWDESLYQKMPFCYLRHLPSFMRLCDKRRVLSWLMETYVGE